MTRKPEHVSSVMRCLMKLIRKPGSEQQETSKSKSRGNGPKDGKDRTSGRRTPTCRRLVDYGCIFYRHNKLPCLNFARMELRAWYRDSSFPTRRSRRTRSRAGMSLAARGIVPTGRRCRHGLVAHPGVAARFAAAELCRAESFALYLTRHPTAAVSRREPCIQPDAAFSCSPSRRPKMHGPTELRSSRHGRWVRCFVDDAQDVGGATCKYLQTSRNWPNQGQFRDIHGITDVGRAKASVFPTYQVFPSFRQPDALSSDLLGRSDAQTSWTRGAGARPASRIRTRACEHRTCEHRTCEHRTCEHRTCEHRTCGHRARGHRARGH